MAPKTLTAPDAAVHRRSEGPAVRRAVPEGVAARALGAALEEVPGPAYVVSSAGELVTANDLGREGLQQGSVGPPRELLAHARRQPGARAVPLGQAAGTSYWFLAFRAPTDREARLRRAAARWALTPRQTEVLRHLVGGESNKGIAQLLGCTEATVELHVTHILARAGVDSRTRAIARFYQGD